MQGSGTEEKASLQGKRQEEGTVNRGNDFGILADTALSNGEQGKQAHMAALTIT